MFLLVCPVAGCGVVGLMKKRYRLAAHEIIV
jgi:hypothetical protein